MLAFDTETTGLLRPEATELYLQPFIIEICMIKFNDEFEIKDKFTTLLKPPVPVSEEITKITKIDNIMLQDAPSFIEIYDDLCDFVIGEDEIFAHNATFDIQMLANELRRHDLLLKFPWPKHHRCTVESSQSLKNKRLNLQTLYEMATGNKEIKNAHRAESDVLAMIECIQWLKEMELI